MRRASILAALALLAALLTALGAVAPTASAGLVDDPDAGRPDTGTCYLLTPKQAAAESVSADPVACSSKHTAMVTTSFRIDPALYDASLERASEVVDARCYAALAKALGGDAGKRASSAYYFTWFFPTEADREDGAEWASCHVNLAKNNNRQLAALAPKFPLLKTVSKGEKRCLKGTRELSGVTCADRHDWAPTKTVAAGSYPNSAKAAKIAKRNCAVGRKPYAWSVGSKTRWNNGFNRLVCFKQV